MSGRIQRAMASIWCWGMSVLLMSLFLLLKCCPPYKIYEGAISLFLLVPKITGTWIDRPSFFGGVLTMQRIADCPATPCFVRKYCIWLRLICQGHDGRRSKELKALCHNIFEAKKTRGNTTSFGRAKLGVTSSNSVISPSNLGPA